MVFVFFEKQDEKKGNYGQNVLEKRKKLRYK